MHDEYRLLLRIYASCFLVFALFGSENTSGTRGAVLTLALAAFAVLVTAIYILFPDPVLHETAHALQVKALAYFLRSIDN